MIVVDWTDGMIAVDWTIFDGFMLMLLMTMEVVSNAVLFVGKRGEENVISDSCSQSKIVAPVCSRTTADTSIIFQVPKNYHL